MDNETWFKDMLDQARDTQEFRLEALEIVLTERILEIMELKNISRSELAEKLNVSRAAVTKLLRDGSNITLKRLIGIACALESEIEIKIEPRQVGKIVYSMDMGFAYVRDSNIYDFARIKQFKADGQTKTISVRTEVSFQDLSEEYLNVGNGY